MCSKIGFVNIEVRAARVIFRLFPALDIIYRREFWKLYTSNEVFSEMGRNFFPGSPLMGDIIQSFPNIFSSDMLRLPDEKKTHINRW